jgi:hypothetical protein
MITPPIVLPMGQEQHQKMFAEMQKALQNTQQKSSKPQTMELSVRHPGDAGGSWLTRIERHIAM